MAVPVFDPNKPLDTETAPTFDPSKPLDTDVSFSEAFSRWRRVGAAETVSAGIAASSEAQPELAEAADPETGATEETLTPLTPKEEQARQSYIIKKRAERKAYKDQLLRAAQATDEGNVTSFIAKWGGLIAGSFQDPVAIATLPVGSGKRIFDLARLSKLASASAGYEATATALSQQTEGKPTNLTEIGGRAGIAALMVPGLDIVLRGTGRGVLKALGKGGDDPLARVAGDPDPVFTNKEISSLNNTLTKLEDKVAEHVRLGKSGMDALNAAEKDLNLSPEATRTMINATGRDLVVPTPEQATKAAELANTTVDKWKAGGVVSDLLVPIHTRIKAISQPIALQLRKWVLETKALYHDSIQGTKPLVDALNKLAPLQKELAHSALMDGKFNVLERIFRTAGIDVSKALASHKATMATFAKLYKGSYKKFKEVVNYSPRIIRDPKEFLKKLPNHERSIVEQALEDAAVALHGKSGTPLTEVEASKVIHDVLIRGVSPRGKVPSSVHSRKWKEVPAYMKDQYLSYEEAIHMYIRDSVNDLSKRKLLGKYSTNKGKTTALDYETSISNWLAKHPEIYKDKEKFKELNSLLLSFLYTGDKAPSKLVQNLRNVAYTATLSNPISALSNLKDIGMSMQKFGPLATLRSILGKKEFRVANFALDDAAQEMVHSPSKSARIMEKSLNAGGFHMMDVKGKEILLNAAWKNYKKLSRSPKGQQKIAQKYAAAFEDDFPKLMEALQKGEVNEHTKLLLFSELSDLQPISKLEMPKAWLDNPNGRIMYTLKTFQLRQLDTILNDTVRTIAKGGYKNIYEGTKNLAKYTIFLGGAGAGIDYIRDLVKGKAPSLETLPEKVTDNLLGALLMDRYSLQKGAESQKPISTQIGGAGGILDIPTTPLFDMIKIVSGDMELKDAKSFSYIPLVGRIWYYWVGGGYEKSMKKGEDRLF